MFQKFVMDLKWDNQENRYSNSLWNDTNFVIGYSKWLEVYLAALNNLRLLKILIATHKITFWA